MSTETQSPFEEAITQPYEGPIAELSGYRVVDDEDDDPKLLMADGSPVDTWREDYPYDERLSAPSTTTTKGCSRSSC